MEIKIILTILLTALAGFGVTYYVGNNILLKKRREEIIKCAEQDGENIKKEKIFQAKEKRKRQKKKKKARGQSSASIGCGPAARGIGPTKRKKGGRPSGSPLRRAQGDSGRERRSRGARDVGARRWREPQGWQAECLPYQRGRRRGRGKRQGDSPIFPEKAREKSGQSPRKRSGGPCVRPMPPPAIAP